MEKKKKVWYKTHYREWVYMGFDGEQIFEGTRPLKYVHKPSENKILIVIFSGFSMPGKPPVYNYIQTLSGIDCNKLFILDDHNDVHQTKASYYLGKNRSHDVEMSVVALITKIANENNIPRERIILAGSSKGGFAALYFGLKYSYGHVISGGPQIFLAKYLVDRLSAASGVASYIAGGIDEESKNYLNSLMINLPKTNPPNIYIHVGKGDHHYQDHVQPFLEHLDRLHIDYDLDVGDYTEHGDLGKYFPAYMVDRINILIKGFVIEDTKLQRAEERLEKILNSKAWRYVARYRKAKSFLQAMFNLQKRS